MNHITLTNVSKHFGANGSTDLVLDNVSYRFDSQYSYALMGPSGVGKSTLLHILAGLEVASAGTIAFNNHLLTSNNFEDRMKALHAHIGIVLQNPSLISELSVLENVMLNALAHNEFSPEYTQKAHSLLTDVGLENKATASCLTLSGGQQQRIAILRAIFHQPHFLLADEPTGNLDQTTAQSIMQLLKMYHKKYQMGLIISTHDPAIAQQCDVVLTLSNYNLIPQ